MSRSLFDTSFPPPSQIIIRTTLISSPQLQPLPPGTRTYRLISEHRTIERSPSLFLWTPVLAAAVSRGQLAKYAHSCYVSLMSEVAYCQAIFFMTLFIIDSIVAPFFVTTCVVCRS
jgi:hypothetical protein